MTDKKRPDISPEEERMQRALGTLPRFEVQIERTITKSSFARVYVTAGNEETAKIRAIEFASREAEASEQDVSDNVKDDTGNPISWADNQKGDVSKPTAIGIREITASDYLTHRFEKTPDPDADEDEGKLDASTLGTPM